ncbi:DNA-methyltransferase [Terasakiella sp.]|uniref:DNA-methyltransferase n=1 Tax=Terasakiella sp. TaxID=2034861 RepID=UPI003AA86669
MEAVKIGFCTLYHGDSDDILPVLGPVEALVSDPQYEFDASGGGIFRQNRKCMDEIQKKGLDKGFDVSVLNPLLYPSVTVFCHNDQLSKILHYLAGNYHRYMVGSWHKTNPMPVRNKHYLPDTEFYVHAWNKGAHPVGEHKDMGRYYISAVGAQKEYDHPTVKPLPLMEKIISNVNAQTIVDPYMGTGTTGEACIRHGRNFIGIEKDADYYGMAVRRIRKAHEKFLNPGSP